VHRHAWSLHPVRGAAFCCAYFLVRWLTLEGRPKGGCP
jgi:hypothetical protein